MTDDRREERAHHTRARQRDSPAPRPPCPRFATPRGLPSEGRDAARREEGAWRASGLAAIAAQRTTRHTLTTTPPRSRPRGEATQPAESVSHTARRAGRLARSAAQRGEGRRGERAVSLRQFLDGAVDSGDGRRWDRAVFASARHASHAPHSSGTHAPHATHAPRTLRASERAPVARLA
jgi:hypothetical protein